MATDNANNNGNDSSSSICFFLGGGFFVIPTVHHFWCPVKGWYEYRAPFTQEWPQYPETCGDDLQVLEWERLEAIAAASDERKVFDGFQPAVRQKPQRQSKRMCCRHFKT